MYPHTMPIDINECVEMSDDCSRAEPVPTCINLEGTYRCSCDDHSGYRLNGTACEGMATVNDFSYMDLYVDSSSPITQILMSVKKGCISVLSCVSIHQVPTIAPVLKDLCSIQQTKQPVMVDAINN